MKVNYWFNHKNNKKGFTLVELVVVIAILAILAAIAIPAVISVMSGATRSAAESEAAEMDQACKTYYAGIKSGMITRELYTPEHTSDIIPSKKASLTTRARLAKKCTVGGALEYSGLYDIVARIEDYGYTSNGEIRALESDVDGSLTALTAGGTDTFQTLNYAN